MAALRRERLDGGFCAGADVGEALGASVVRVAAENAGLVARQHAGPGLPQRKDS